MLLDLFKSIQFIRHILIVECLAVSIDDSICFLLVLKLNMIRFIIDFERIFIDPFGCLNLVIKMYVI